MSVGQICVRQVDLISPDESVRAAAARLRDRAVGSLIVGQEGGAPMGILTDRDIAVRVVAEGRDPIETTVAEVMTQAPRCVREGTPIEQALALMRCGPHRRLPVINEAGQLTGVVALDDILSLLANEFREISGLLHRESPTSLASAG